MTQEQAKKNAGVAAAALIQSDMLVGLGTGSTAFYLIDELGRRCAQEGLKIQAVASSTTTREQAQKNRIPLVPIDDITCLDITVDGADEIDKEKRMIKGGGGALLREKIVASMSREMVVIVDETKLVSRLGKCKLPVEIIPFGLKAMTHQLEKLGFQGTWRKNQEGSFFVTDNGNYIFDIHFQEPLDNPQEQHEALIHLPAVVETGFFFNLAGRVVIGFLDGQVIIRE